LVDRNYSLTIVILGLLIIGIFACGQEIEPVRSLKKLVLSKKDCQVRRSQSIK